MTFVLIGYDGPDGTELRKRCREAHLQRLKALESEKRLLLAGPFSDKTGSLIVFEAESPEEAVAWAEEDPYVREKVFIRYEIKPFIQVFPGA